MDKRDIKDLTLEELQAEVEGWGEPRFRAIQIFDWVYRKGISSFSAATDLPLALRQKLEACCLLRPLELEERLLSADGTEKYLLRLADGEFIETVLIPSGRRQTLCLSTQVGCKFGCVFCASGMGGFKRNLRPSEIVEQILFLRNRLEVHLTNYVFMGMGEPLDNAANVVKAIRIMNAPQGLGIAARRITVSTCGIIPGIKRLQDLGLQVNLSLSLHAISPELRSRLLPLSRKYPLPELVKALLGYMRKTGRRLTLEYVLLGGVNDSIAEARRLAGLARKLRANVNLIPLSPVLGLESSAPPGAQVRAFQRALEERGIRATLRRSRGGDIQAACGQLAGKKRGFPRK
jgi:23S rRNA (adenine2503-C2)-methyltransferase